MKPPILFTLLVSLLIHSSCGSSGSEDLQKCEEQLKKVRESYVSMKSEEPALLFLQELRFKVSQSQALIKDWVNRPSMGDDPTKKKLSDFWEALPDHQAKLEELAETWEDERAELSRSIASRLDSLHAYHDTVMSSVVDFNSYDDPGIMFPARAMVYPNGDIANTTKDIDKEFDRLAELQETVIEETQNELEAELGVE